MNVPVEYAELSEQQLLGDDQAVDEYQGNSHHGSSSWQQHFLLTFRQHRPDMRCDDIICRYRVLLLFTI